MASLTKTTTGGKVFYRLQFSADDKRRTLHLGNIRESAANKIKSRIEDLVTDAKLKNKPDAIAQQWIMEVDVSTFEKLASWGLLSTVPELIQRRREQENPDLIVKRESVVDYLQWYIGNRKADCEPSTIRKITASLNQLNDYCRDIEGITAVDDITPEMAFRFQLHRLESKAEATVSADVKIAKTAFAYGVKSGRLSTNPYTKLKPGSDVNVDGRHIIPISDYEKLIDACPDSDWRTIIALARLGGLRCPSELVGLKWTDVKWDIRRLRILSPKTKRKGKPERMVPLFDRLDKALSDHWDLTGEKSEYVITQEHLRRRGVSLSERFQRIREAAGVPLFENPFRNMRLSAVNDVCRIPGDNPENDS